MEPPRFTKRNERFECVACGRQVQPHASSSRDHCDACLTGLHVDVNPGDRMSDCGGVLRPIGLAVRSGKTKIVYRCDGCHALIYNLVAPDDDPDRIAELASMPWKDDSTLRRRRPEPDED